MAPGWRDFVSLAVFLAQREEEFRARAEKYRRVVPPTRRHSLHPGVIPGRRAEPNRNLEISGSMLRIAPE
jgi:hypothetical protein